MSKLPGEVVDSLTRPARLVASRLKERSVLTLSLAEMAVCIEPNLPGLVLPKHHESRMAMWDKTRSGELREYHSSAMKRAASSGVTGYRLPVQSRFLPGGAVLPALEDEPEWVVALELARAVVVELETLGLLERLEVRGHTVSEKWTLTPFGKTCAKLLSVQDWRQAAGKKEA